MNKKEIITSVTGQVSIYVARYDIHILQLYAVLQIIYGKKEDKIRTDNLIFSFKDLQNNFNFHTIFIKLK